MPITDSQLRKYLKDPHQFRREQIILPSGAVYGDVEEPWQREIWEAVDDPGRHVVYVELSRGHAKTTMASMAVLSAALLSDSWEIYYFGGDKDQATIGFTILKNLIQANPDIEPAFRIFKDRVEVASTGTTIRPMAADETGTFGIGGLAKGFMCVIDEAWVWKSQLLWEAIISSTGKVGDRYKILCLSNAGIEGVSTVAWPIREACRKREEPGFWFFRSDGCIASWVTESWKRQQRRLLTPDGYRRLIDNEWTAGESQAISAEDFNACLVRGMKMFPEPDGQRLYIGIDASRSERKGSDTTAAVAVRKNGEYIELVAHKIWTPRGRATEFDASEKVFPWLHELREKGYRLGLTGADPYNMRNAIRQGRKEGIKIEPVDQTPVHQTEIAQSLIDSIYDRTFRTYPCADLREHCLNARLVEDVRGRLRLDKARQTKKIDGAVALGIALLFATEYGGRGEWRMWTGSDAELAELRERTGGEPERTKLGLSF